MAYLEGGRASSWGERGASARLRMGLALRADATPIGQVAGWCATAYGNRHLHNVHQPQ
ncbi:hypothetical protein IG631_20838 [Alternaria alternata]|nr:hypothetical protein IG631_20838 [Alternaria alternata]